MEQFLYIYGPVPNDVNWNAIKKSRCAQIIRAYALADEADRLNVVPDSVIDKIEIAHMFYLAADQAVIEFGPQAVNLPGADIDFQFFRKVAYYLNLTKFESIFIEKSKELPAAKNMWIDKNYILSLPWTIQRAYTPEQASYF